MKDLLLCKPGEIFLKGLNKHYFEERLVANVKRRLKPIGHFRVTYLQSALYIEAADDAADLDAAYDAVRKVFGIATITRAAACEKDKDAITALAKSYLHDAMTAAHSFKVETKRSDKRFPMTSIELSQYVGGELAEAFPNTQRRIVEKCICAKRPVIIATQMLYSMVKSPRPTRAEVSDVASAIYERVDAVMLSGETANGLYPVEAVATMARVAREIENDEVNNGPNIDMNLVRINNEITAQLARSAVRASINLRVKAIVIDKPGLNLANGAIGIGEITSIPTAPAIAQAYYRYDGERRRSLPLDHTPYKK